VNTNAQQWIAIGALVLVKCGMHVSCTGITLIFILMGVLPINIPGGHYRNIIEVIIQAAVIVDGGRAGTLTA
jgi:hypothetical protein